MIYYFVIKNVPNNDESTATNEPAIQVQQPQPPPPTTMIPAAVAATTYPMYQQQQSVMITGTEPITPNNLAQPPHMGYLYYTAYPNHPTTPVGLEYVATIPEYAQTPATAAYHNPYSPNPLTTGYKSHHQHHNQAAVYHSYHYAPTTPSTPGTTTVSTANTTAYTWPTPTTPIQLASYSPNDYSKQVFGYNVSYFF